MSDKDLQRVTESLSDIGQASKRQNPPPLQLVDETLSVLTRKEEAFCLAIVDGLNESDAYRKAYKPQRGKAKTIHEKASRIMARGKVRERVAELMAPLIAEAIMQRQEWLVRLTRCAPADVRKMFDSQGKPLPITALGPNEAAALAGFECCEQWSGKGEHRVPVGMTMKYKLIDALRALELIGKARKFYAERMEVTGTTGEPTPNHVTVEFIEGHVRDGASYLSVECSTILDGTNLRE